MFEIVKNVILSKNYKLEDMLNKINVLWLESKLSDEEKTSLISLSRENALAENSYKPVQEQLDKAFKMIDELKETVEANAIGQSELKNAVEKLGGKVESIQTPAKEKYPEYVKPSGAHDAYNEGDGMTYNGTKYESLINNNVWTPDDYPQGWKKVEETEKNTEIEVVDNE